MEAPSPRKYASDAPVYMSRQFGLPEDFGRIVLSDFGEAVKGDVERRHNAQPEVYRSPEVMLQAPWSYPIDIWNVGSMVCPSEVSATESLLMHRRSGTSLKGVTCSTAWIPAQRRAITPRGRTSQRLSGCSVRRRWICYTEAREATSSSLKMDGGLRIARFVEETVLRRRRWFSKGGTRTCSSTLSGGCWRGGQRTGGRRESCLRTLG